MMEDGLIKIGTILCLIGGGIAIIGLFCIMYYAVIQIWKG